MPIAAIFRAGSPQFGNSAVAVTAGSCRAALGLDGPRAAVPTRAYKLNAVGALADQGQEFGSCFLFVAEAAKHGRGYRRRMLFLYAAHHHAEMPGLDDHADALGLDGVLDRLGDLRGQALLDLQAARKQFDEAGYFAQTD